MIPLGGVSSLVGLKLVDATKAGQIDLIKNSAQNSRSIAAFKDRIGAIQNVDQLMEDRELYVFMMKAFDLEDQIFGKAMITKILESNIDDPAGLVNRLTDPRFREMHETMQFGPNGQGNLVTLLTTWQDDMVNRFVERQFINSQEEESATIGAVLEFRRMAPTATTAFDFLKDPQMSKLIRTVLGIPQSSAGIDIDRQAAEIEKRLDFAKLKDPVELEKMVQRYVVVSDALDNSRVAQNAAVQLMSAAIRTRAGAQFVPITLDITAINFSSYRAYR